MTHDGTRPGPQTPLHDRPDGGPDGSRGLAEARLATLQDAGLPIVYAGYLSMLYLIIGVMEAWANPPQRITALLQVLLVGVFVISAVALSRTSPARN